MDLVYLWVDFDDPAWKKKMLSYPRGGSSENVTSARPSDSLRFKSYDELRYSLRSVERYLPWSGRIFIVTDQQQPIWLNSSHPRIRIVDHRDIFPNQEDLPNFCSDAIESNIWRIPDLSPEFIYLNDDMMLLREVELSYFKNVEGQLKFGLQPFRMFKRRLSNDPFYSIWFNNEALLFDVLGDFYQSPCHWRNIANRLRRVTLGRINFLDHFAQAYSKEILQQTAIKFHSAFATTSKGRFRQKDGFALLALAVYFSFYLKTGVPVYDRQGVYVGRSEGKTRCERKFAKIIALPEHLRPHNLCVNDSYHPHFNHADWSEILQKYLNILFPDKSSFEI